MFQWMHYFLFPNCGKRYTHYILNIFVKDSKVNFRSEFLLTRMNQNEI